MTTIVTRAGKGSPLTNTEMDTNLTNINTDKLEKSNNLSELTNATTALINLGERTGATGSIKNPAGTTAERDSSPQFGWQRANSTLSQMEWYNGSAWVPMGGGAPAGFRNKIINGAFGINQRVYVSGAATSAGQYTLDRWKVTGTGGITFSTVNNKTTVTIPAGQTLQQVIEGLNLATGDYVLSWEGTAQGRIGASSYGASGSVKASITGGTNTTIEFNTGTVENVQLEAGSIATPFEHRPYGLELSLCQRYYRTSYIGVAPGSVSSIGVVYGGHYYNSSSTADGVGVIKIDYGVDMRTTPTVAVYSPNSGAINNVFDNLDRAATIAGNSLRGLYVNYTGNGGIVGQVHYTASSEL